MVVSGMGDLPGERLIQSAFSIGDDGERIGWLC